MQMKKLILVAEDDNYYANIFNSKLTKEGFQVMLAANGKDALELAKQSKPDLILLDLIMPVMDGFESLKELKADPKLSDIKVIVLSNLGQEEDIVKARELGAVDYMVKSNVGIAEVVEKVKSSLVVNEDR